MITQEKIKILFHYNPSTGIFTRTAPRRGVKFGATVGTVSPDGYVCIMIDGSRYLAHRLAWLYVNGKFPKAQIDHINHIKNDNSLANLRDVTVQDNQRNRVINKNNTSGVTGVYWNKSSKKWQAHIAVDGKIKYLGVFNDLKDAAAARKVAERDAGYHENHGAAVIDINNGE